MKRWIAAGLALLTGGFAYLALDQLGLVAGLRARVAQPAREQSTEPPRGEPGPGARPGARRSRRGRATQETPLVSSPLPPREVSPGDALATSDAPGLFPARTTFLPPRMGGPLVADPLSQTEVALSWEPAEGDGRVRYELLQDGEVVGTSAWASGFVNGLSPGTEYCFAVRALDDSGHRSHPTRTVCSRTLDEEARRP